MFACFLAYWRMPKKCYGFTSFVLLTCFAFILWQSFQAKQKEAQVPEQVSQVTLIPDTVTVNGDRLSFRGSDQGQTYQVFYQFQNPQEKRWFEENFHSLKLQVTAKLEMPERQRNFQGYDYRNYLRTQGIYRILQIRSISSIDRGNLGVRGVLAEWRRACIVHIQKHFPAPMQHYMTGLLFGYLDKSFDEMSEIYTSLGIIHLFALSGMQVGFFLAAFRFCYLRLGGYRDWLFWGQLPFAVLYGALTGGTVSVLRSLTQSQLSFLGLRSWDNLALTVLVLIGLMPQSLLTAGGVLSLAYAFILSSCDWEKWPKMTALAMEIVTISLGALPILLYYYGIYQPLSIPLTALFSFVFDLLMLPGLTLLFILSCVYPVTQVNGSFKLLEHVLTFIEKNTIRPLVLGKPSLLLCLLLLILLGLLLDFWSKKSLRLSLGIVLVVLFFSVKWPLTNEVTIIDVGQGDSIFLRDMRGKTILIDTGGKVTFGSKDPWRSGTSTPNAQKTVIPYLQARGVGKIDQLVLTHTDTDHVGDLLELAKNVKIGEILVSPGSLTQKDFVQTLKASGSRVNILQAGGRLAIMGTYLECLYPQRTGDGGNNDSLVLYGSLLGQRFLFTGDLEAEGEQQLLQTYPNLPVDILKAGHHGSKGSSSPEFLKAIKAKLALVSAGKNNRYQHPHLETLERFQAQQMAVLRTDQQGAIRFTGWTHWHIETVHEAE
nr:DNA internalization-related competence protein ComEC/Rec2 [Streptococcus sp. DD12]